MSMGRLREISILCSGSVVVILILLSQWFPSCRGMITCSFGPSCRLESFTDDIVVCHLLFKHILSLGIKYVIVHILGIILRGRMGW